MGRQYNNRAAVQQFPKFRWPLYTLCGTLLFAFLFYLLHIYRFIDIENFIGSYISDPATKEIAKSVDFAKDVKPVAVEVDNQDFIAKQTVSDTISASGM